MESWKSGVCSLLSHCRACSGWSGGGSIAGHQLWIDASFQMSCSAQKYSKCGGTQPSSGGAMTVKGRVCSTFLDCNAHAFHSGSPWATLNLGWTDLCSRTGPLSEFHRERCPPHAHQWPETWFSPWALMWAFAKCEAVQPFWPDLSSAVAQQSTHSCCPLLQPYALAHKASFISCSWYKILESMVFTAVHSNLILWLESETLGPCFLRI